MNLFENVNSIKALKNEINKARTQEDINKLKNRINESLIFLTDKQIETVVNLYNDKGGKLSLNECLKLKEDFEDVDSDFLDDEDEYVDIDDDENFIEECDLTEDEQFKKVKVTNIEPYYTMEDIDPEAASDLGMTNQEYLDYSIERIKTDMFNEPFYINVPEKYFIGEDELKDYISDYISDETGYLVDSFDYELCEDENCDESCQQALQEDEQEGSYEVKYAPYERYGSDSEDDKPRVISIDAASDLGAFIELINQLETYLNAEQIVCDDEEKQMALDDGYDEEELFTTVEELTDYLASSNGDGCDFIYYIKRPDGSYLFRDEYDIQCEQQGYDDLDDDECDVSDILEDEYDDEDDDSWINDDEEELEENKKSRYKIEAINNSKEGENK